VKTYFDSSAFVKRFINERGSDDVAAVCVATTELGLSVICIPEILSAFNRKCRENLLSRGQYTILKRRLLADTDEADIINLSPAVISTAIGVLETNTLRAMDALHIACALAWEAELFVSSDERQIIAAKRVGLKTRQV
jgi:predicted nucleic acid-binding protein